MMVDAVLRCNDEVMACRRDVEAWLFRGHFTPQCLVTVTEAAISLGQLVPWPTRLVLRRRLRYQV